MLHRNCAYYVCVSGINDESSGDRQGWPDRAGRRVNCSRGSLEGSPLEGSPEISLVFRAADNTLKNAPYRDGFIVTARSSYQSGAMIVCSVGFADRERERESLLFCDEEICINRLTLEIIRRIVRVVCGATCRRPFRKADTEGSLVGRRKSFVASTMRLIRLRQLLLLF